MKISKVKCKCGNFVSSNWANQHNGLCVICSSTPIQKRDMTQEDWEEISKILPKNSKNYKPIFLGPDNIYSLD